MTALPPSPFFNSDDSVALTSDEAAADVSSQAPAAAVGICEPTTDGGGPQESPAPGQELCGAGDLDLIGEIFRGARKLNLPRFKLDEERFMIDIEEPPLFLRAAQ